MIIAGLLHSRLRELSLGQKLVWLTGLSTTVGAVAAGTALYFFQLQTLRTEFRDQITMLTSLVASYSAATVAFENREEARSVLLQLQSNPTIAKAELRLPNDELFVRIGESQIDEDHPQVSGTAAFVGDWLHANQPVILENETIAQLHVVASFEPVRRASLGRIVIPLAGIVLLGFGSSALTAFALRGSIIGPIQHLAHIARRIATERDYSLRAIAESGDEVGQLTGTINTMLERIQAADRELRDTNTSLAAEIAERQRLQGALLETSRIAGMAEIATGVLHNVGNVLNSVNVSTTLVREELSRSSLASLQRTLDLLRQHRDHLGAFLSADPRGSQIPLFLEDIGRELAAEQARIRAELDSLGANIDHIKEIVSMQQAYARSAAVIEQVHATSLFDDALRIAQASLTRHGVDLVRESPASDPVLEIDRHKALQILINFISNAVHATKTNSAGRRRITLRIQLTDTDHVRFIVIDNGMGIENELLPRLFNHGFTTRKDGHGFGLHSGAIAARALGGSVGVASDGPGHGATFTLDVPLAPHSTSLSQ